MNLAQRRTAKSAAAKINYVDIGPRQGSHPPYLLIHGLGASLHYWSGILLALSADRRVVAIDVPGFGDSPALPSPRDIEVIIGSISQLVEDLELEHVKLVGHSLGGLLALLLAEQIPSSGVVLIDAHLLTSYEVLRVPYRAIFHPKAAITAVALLVGLTIPYRASMVRMVAGSSICRRLIFGYMVARPSKLDPRLLREAFSRSRNRGVVGALRAARRINVEKLMEDNSASVALVWGANDPLISDRDSVIAKRLLRPRKSIAIPRCGHWPMLEQPTVLVHIIRSVDDEG